jgi:hypothetical protein
MFHMEQAMTETTIGRYEVARVRDIAVTSAGGMVARARTLLSMMPNGGALADLLRGEKAELVQAEIAHLLMTKLGHVSPQSPNDAASEVRRAVRGKGR